MVYVRVIKDMYVGTMTWVRNGEGTQSILSS